MNNERRCGWCIHAVGTTSKAYIFCAKERTQELRDASLKCFERELGADDDKDEK